MSPSEEISTTSQNPIADVRKIIAELNLLMQDLQKNEKEILALKDQLYALVDMNRGTFSNIEVFDVYSFCSGINFAYSHSDPCYLGLAEGYFANVKLDFSQNAFPIIPQVPQQFLEYL